MADESGPDLVSNLNITGGDTVVNTLQDVSDKGGAALDKLADKAKAASDTIATSSDAIASNLGKIGQAVPDSSAADHIKNIEAAALNFGVSVRQAGVNVAEFGAKIVALGAAGVGAVVGIAKMAEGITKAARGSVDSTSDLTRQQELMNRQQVRNVETSVQYQNSLDGLTRQLSSGKLTFVQYGEEVKKLDQTFADNARAHEALQAAQAETLKKNEALQRQASQREAYNALAKTYGVDLTNSLITLGRAAEEVHKQIVNAFGPVLASLVDKITEVIDKNSGTITKFVDTAAKALGDFVKQSGPSMDQLINFVSNVGKAALKITQDILIPAFKGVMSVLNDIAGVINKVFGTEITGEFLLMAAIVLKLTGGFTALFSLFNVGYKSVSLLIALFGPWGILIAAVAVGLVALYFAVDWKALGDKIAEVYNSMKDGFKKAVDDVTKFFTDFPGNLETVWKAVKDGAQKLWDQLVQAVLDMWEKIKQSFSDGVDKAKALMQDLYDMTIGRFDGIIKKAKEMAAAIASAFSGDSSGPTAADLSGNSNFAGLASGGHVQGPGTWTSDSILARLSNNEFVVQARAVAKYGVSLLNSLNQGTLDPSRLAGYAMGGLVTSSPIPAFAGGGQVSRAGRVLNLHIDGMSFNGLSMPENVADKMTKYAVGKQTSSAGRKPSWVGGNR